MILAIATSTTSGSVALVDSCKVIAATQKAHVEAHAKWLMGSIDALLSDADITLTDIELIAIGTGPGSFTGLRIGVSTVKGLSWALSKPIVGVSTLRALALNVKGPALICPVLDARKKQVYTALYRNNGTDGTLEEVMEDVSLTPVRLCEEIEKLSKGEAPVFLGSGLNVYMDVITEGVPGAGFAPKDDWLIRAENIALIAAGVNAETIPAEALVPLYRRRSEAEIGGGSK